MVENLATLLEWVAFLAAGAGLVFARESRTSAMWKSFSVAAVAAALAIILHIAS